MDKHSAEQRSYNMSRIRSRDTIIEITLRNALWSEGIRYRKNYSKLPGKPDIVLTKWKIAVFCDSEFWHGKDFTSESFEATPNQEYWRKKIRNNINRDIEINDKLCNMGYQVMRFWGKDITEDTDKCVDEIKRLIEQKK